MAKTITSANAVFALSIPGIFNTPVLLEGYAADDAFSSDSVQKSETQMGVDGKLSAGFTFNPIKMKVKLAADSSSIDVFDTWNAVQQSTRDLFFANATVTLPGPGETYNLVKGALTSFKPMPDAKKVLQSREFEITFESVTKANI